MSLDEALKIVKLAGYRVTKPKPKKQTRVGPTCVVMYSDGITCRMTCASPDDKPDFARGFAACSAAWESRWRKQTGTADTRLASDMLANKIADRYRNALMDASRVDSAIWRVVARKLPQYSPPTPPAISRAWFERNGDVLAVWQGEAIAA